MSADTAFEQFLGDSDKRFCLTPALIPELENVLGAGIGTIFKRLSEGHFRHADILHTIRLGLIGGGMKPEDAAQLTRTYVADRPLIETMPIALKILEILWFGAPVMDAVLSEIKGADNAAA